MFNQVYFCEDDELNGTMMWVEDQGEPSPKIVKHCLLLYYTVVLA